VPYARESIIELLGAEPTSYASAETAQALALAAYRRAVRS
jgi:TRAP-type C4-dicarboxylate transport system substrate-binding protein